MTLSFSIFSILFVFSLIYLRQFKKKKVRQHSEDEDSLSESDDRLLRVADSVDAYFSSNQIYLDAKLSCTMVGDYLKMNPRLIANAIRYKHGISLRDYINENRIRYIEEVLIPSNDFKKYSLDYIAEMAGFGTRQGFYIALKKLKNCTPKEYFGELV